MTARVHYVHVIGPYDNTFVGPFPDFDHASSWTTTLDRRVFSAYVLTGEQFAENIAQYGPTETQSPEGLLQ